MRKKHYNQEKTLLLLVIALMGTLLVRPMNGGGSHIDDIPPMIWKAFP